MDEDNLRLLQQRSLLICLRADLNTILRRAGSGKQRPLLVARDRVERIEELLRQREKYYAHAQISVDTSNLTVDEVVDKIIALAGRSQDHADP
jgi:shikimate kinase